jgi:hypothetical protein
MEQIESDVCETLDNSDAESPEKSADSPVSDDRSAEIHATSVPAQEVSASVHAEPGSKPATCAERVFFPCNREDGLVLLGGLCISEFFPDQTINLAVQPEGVALVTQGLRHTEEEMLNAGRPERFPILIEVAQCVANETPRIIEYKDILGLVFRKQSEADEFRFRPVDEFDTETFGFKIEGELFGLEGSPRFAIRFSDDVSKLRVGHAADRLAAGVHCVLSLGNARPRCRKAIAGFLAGSNDGPAGHEEIDFVASARIVAGQNPDGKMTAHLHAVISAFADAESPGPRILVEEVFRRLLLVAGSDEESKRREGRWADVARNVIKGRKELNGDQLADDKSVILRAALLGTIVDKVDALLAFLDAEKPSGPRVTAVAAYLVGLKQGLINLSWKDKKSQVQQLSSLSGAMLRVLSTIPGNVDGLLSVTTGETDVTTILSVSAGDVRLAEWVEKKHVPPDAVSQRWLDEFSRLGYDVTGPGRETYSWTIRLSGSLSVEIVRLQIGSAEFSGFRYRLPEGAQLKKQKDLNGIIGIPGSLWHSFRDSENQEMLYCDLVSLPTKSELGSLAAQLEHLLGLCTVQKKVRKSRVPKSASPAPSGLPRGTGKRRLKDG